MMIATTDRMGKFKNPRITFICDESVKRKLEQRAEVEHRTLSNLVEFLVTESLNNYSQPNVDAKVIPTPEALLESLLSNEPLSDIEITHLSQEYKISTSVLLRMRDRLFPKLKTGTL